MQANQKNQKGRWAVKEAVDALKATNPDLSLKLEKTQREGEEVEEAVVFTEAANVLKATNPDLSMRLEKLAAGHAVPEAKEQAGK